MPAAADLIAAIADLENGTVVLPGLDLSMPAEQWAMLEDDGFLARPDPASRSHPQFGLHRLMKKMGVDRDEVVSLATVSEAMDFRAETFSQALVPAAATDGWTRWRQDHDPAELHSAFADVSLIKAANEREEAVAISIALRLALEEPGESGGQARAALITPDRALARRVTAELARFGILADDTAGAPLSGTPQGGLVQLLLEASLRPGDPVAIVGLLKHPLVRCGLTEADYIAAVEALEVLALRGGVGEMDISLLEPVLEERLAEHEKDRHMPRWRQSLPEGAIEAAKDLAGRITRAVEPLVGMLVRTAPGERGFSTRLPLTDWATRTAGFSRRSVWTSGAIWRCSGPAGRASGFRRFLPKSSRPKARWRPTGRNGSISSWR